MYLVKKQSNFTPLVTSILDGNKYIPARFDDAINDTLDKVIKGEITNLIINMPAGYGKTLKAVWAFVARGFAINPKSRFIHASYSSTLAQDNSDKIMTILKNEDYATLFPYVKIKQGSEAKGLWKTTAGGAFLASASGGAITGFRAGIINSDIFSGAMIIDDPLKPDDARSDSKRSFINNRWFNTFRSRLADQSVPVIVIMQRIHPDDFTNYLLENTDRAWSHLMLPVYISKDYEYKQLGRYIKHNLEEGALWDRKADARQSKLLMRDIQYSQEPMEISGDIFERKWFNEFTLKSFDLSTVKDFSIFCDTASKTGRYNDYSVFQFWGLTASNQGYMLYQERFKVSVPFLLGRFTAFHDHCVKMVMPLVRHISINIEDKDSGVGLIQALILEDYDVTAIQRREGKYARQIKAAPSIMKGLIHLEASCYEALVTEAVKLKEDDSHKHDDQIDPMVDFVNFKLKTDTGRIMVHSLF